MSSIKFSSLAVAMLLTFLCPISSINAATSLFTDRGDIELSTTKKVETGPRDFIIFATEINIIQPESEELSIKITNSNGELVYQTVTSELSHRVSTSGWASGDYTVETVCPDNDYQEFYFVIEG